MSLWRNPKAFTLIELLVVIAVIGILAAAAIPAIMDAICDSKISRAKADLQTMKTAVTQWTVANDQSFWGSDAECNITDDCEPLKKFVNKRLWSNDVGDRFGAFTQGSVKKIKTDVPDGCIFEGDNGNSGDGHITLDITRGKFTCEFC